MTSEEQAKGSESAATDNGAGSKPEADQILEGIRAERKALDKTKEEIQAILREHQTVLARMAISGRSLAGVEAPRELTMEEKAQQMAKESLKRHGINR